MRRLKAVFGGTEKVEHLRGVVSLPGVQVVESHEELYRTVRKLGSGITATVYEGVGRADGVRYALKHFSHASLRGDDEAVELFRTEVEVLRKSGSHRFVVSLHDVVSTPPAAIMVMELVSGGDLMSPIERQGGGPYSERRAQHIFAQMTLAVRHLHSLGIVHRDLKPENVCFTTAEQRWIKLIDLGAAGVLQGGDTDGGGLTELCGTPLYAAPEVTPWFYVKTDEQAARCRRYGKEVDYWSMGITLFVMLSGEAPFQQSGSVERLLSTVCTASIDTSGKTWQAVSAEAKAFVTALLKRDPRARMGLEGIRASPWLSATMGQLEREIEREIAREIAPSPPPPPDTEEEDLALAMALSSSLAEAQEAQEGSSDMIKEPAVAPAPAAAMEAAMDLLGLFDAPAVSQPPPAVPPAASVSAAGAGAGAGSHGGGLLDLFAAPATPMVLGVLGVLGAAPAVPAAAEGEWCIDAATVETFSAMFASACAAQGPGVDRLGKAEAGAVLSLSGLPTEVP